MMRILFLTVGTGRKPDPAKPGDIGNPVWEALAYCIKTRNPDSIVLWCSHKTRDNTVPLLRQLLTTDQQARLEQSVCEDEEDVQTLTLEYGRQIDRCRNQHPDATIEIDYTSGTKAMSAAAVAAGISRGIHHLHYATGPKDESGRAFRTDKLITLVPADLIAERQLDELGRLFNHHQFLAVQMQCKRLLATGVSDQQLCARATSLQLMADAYLAWDLFEWQRAAHTLKRATDDRAVENAGWSIEQLKRQRKYLNRCQNKPRDPARCVDLLVSADRCIAAGCFDDAVSRLYRLTELIGQARLDAHYDLSATDAAPLSQLKSIAPAYTSDRLEKKSRQRNGEKCVDLGLRDNIEVLAEANDPVGLAMRKRCVGEVPGKPGPLQKQLDARNSSYLAHGHVPVPASAAKDLRDTVAAILEEHLAAENAESLPDLLHIARFHQCPWVTSNA